jgi:glycosyltransferase involved in cell wall biosynthesis
VRLAWFTPLPPVRSGIAHYSADLLPALLTVHAIDVFVASPAEIATAEAHALEARPAHDFVWLNHKAPYELVVYQLGNSRCHDFTWPYLFRYPGLVVLHDAHLHHARASALLERRRTADYAAELAFNHPELHPDRAAIGAAGVGGPLYYFWPMVRTVALSARLLAVHNPVVAADLRARFGRAVEIIALGVPDPLGTPQGAQATLTRAHARVRLGVPADAFLVLAYGGLTRERGVPSAIRAVAALAERHPHLRLLLVGAIPDGYDPLADARAAGVADRVISTGYVDERELPGLLVAADAAFCLRWPSARETSAAWVQCIAAGLPTLVSDLAHLVHLPTIEPDGWTPRAGARGQTPGSDPEEPEEMRSDAPRPEPEEPETEPVAIRIDLLDEHRLVGRALQRLITDAALRDTLGQAARSYYERHHTIARMTDDYRRITAEAGSIPPPAADLPSHLRPDPLRLARAIAADIGVDLRLD